MANNKGEWAEPYAAIRILGDKKIHIADENGNADPTEWMNVIELIRHETLNRIVTYRYQPENVVIDIYINEELSVSVEAKQFLVLAEEIRNGKGRSFVVSDEILGFLSKIEMHSIKAKSIDKSDIFLTISDPRASITRKHIGFSIKSQFGNNPTLFNTAKASAVVYQLSNMTDELMEKINSIVDDKGHASVSKRCDMLIENNCEMKYYGYAMAQRTGCATFKENLDLIDPRLPYVIERILWNHFVKHNPKVDLDTVTQAIIDENPCKLTRPEVKYPYMIKSFLYAAYCGMTASTLWDGDSQVNGGFIKVKENGEIIAYYALESGSFKSYLYRNCYLEFPSTDEKHGDYAKVYKEGQEYYFRLNFQIRYR